MANRRARKSGASIPGDWWDSTYERRLRISATNSSGADLHDHLMSYTVPGGTVVDQGSMRVIEHTSSGGVDRAYDWRYGSVQGAVNLLPLVPASIAGQALNFKALGRWQAGETRYWNVYWSGVNGQTAPSYNYIDCVAVAWTAAITAGAAPGTDTYTVTLQKAAGGTQSYTYNSVGGDTATTIAAGLKNLINADGTVATATSGGATLSVFSATPRNPNYATSSTWITASATGTGTYVITAPGASSGVTTPAWFGMGRVGPDTTVIPSAAVNTGFVFGFGTGVPNLSVSQGYLGFGHSGGANQLLRLLRYQVSGDATSYFNTAAAITGVAVTGPTITLTGTFSTTPTGSHPNYWTGTFTATYRHRVYTGIKSDGTSANGMDKSVDLLRLQITWTCQTAYTPTAVGTGNVSSNHTILSLADLNIGFGGNATMLAGYQLSGFSATAGNAPVAVAANADLSALAVIGTVVGNAGNTHALGVRVDACTLAGWGSQAPHVQWFADSHPFETLEITNLTAAQQIPAGATITVDCTFAISFTGGATTVGDNLLPVELVTLLQHVTDAPSVNTLAVETFGAATLYQSMLRASDRALAGLTWFQTNALAKTGLANNFAYEYNIDTGATSVPDDGDGNYGSAHALHGLVLRYLRTKDPTLVAIIEARVNFHLNIEAASVAAYGSWWSGSASYLYWPSTTPSGGTYPNEGGVASGINIIDPNCNQVSSLALGNAGAGITTASVAVAAPPNGGTTAQYTATIAGGQITGFTQVNPGSQYNASPPPNVTITDNGTTHATATAVLTPAQGPLSYTQGQVMRKTSIDQMHMVGHGLYAYLYLLRSDPLITANTALRANATSLLSRMVTFEAAHQTASACVLANLYAIVTGGTPSYANGISPGFINQPAGTTLPNPYQGDMYSVWEIGNADGTLINTSANSSIDYFFRSVYAPNGDNSATKLFIQGRAMDMVCLDLGRHDVTTTITGKGITALAHGTYPNGWNLRSQATGNNGRYNAGRAGDKHYIEIGSGGALDSMQSRAAQRMIVLALACLFDPTWSLPIEEPAVRSTPITTALDDLARCISLYLVEPSTLAVRYGQAGYLGPTQFSSRIVDPSSTGYWLMAIELWFLVQQRKNGTNKLPAYYKFAGF